MKFGYMAKFTAQASKGDELLAILLNAAKALEQNGDCIQYIVSTGEENDAIWVNEIWNSKEAHDKSLEPDEVKTIIKQAMPLIADVSNRTETHIVGGKGIS